MKNKKPQTKLILIQLSSLATYVGIQRMGVFTMDGIITKEQIDEVFEAPDCWKPIKQ